MASPSQPPDPLDRLRRRGRRAGLLVFGLLVAAVTAAWSIQIMLQVWAPAAPPLAQPCRAALLELLQGVNRARQAAAAEVGGEKAALHAFRQALEPSWRTRPAFEKACAGDADALASLREIDELRYAEEHAVRYEAVRLARQRKRAMAIAELLGRPRGLSEMTAQLAMVPELSDAPPPPTFDVLPLTSEVRRAVDELGYVHPTPVQRAVYEPAIRGKDLVVQARTGTGKTASFGLPLIDNLVRRGTPAVQALVLCPTRELALQVTRELDALAKYRGVRCAAVYGGAPMPRQVEAIRGGAQILVGTPGRVLDHLRRKTFDPKELRVAVLDESDEMLSMGFLPQITDIFSFLPETKQTLLFSATLPADIKRLAESRLRNPEFVTLSGDHIGALEINHFVYICQTDKLQALVQILETENPESAVIFCNTRDETKRVATALEQQGYSAAWLNADLAQNEREKVMAATRKSELRFLVATDVAARGIDISHLTHVINFDFPESAEAYVHRTGRTGRAGRTGTAISLIEPSDVGHLYLLRLTYKLKPIERQLPSARELKTRAESDLVKLFVDGLGSRKPHPDDLALARRLVTHERGEAIIATLLRDHLGARPEAAEEATAARRARPPTPVREERDQREARPVRDERDQREARPVRDERDQREARPVRDERDQREARPVRDERDQREARPVRGEREPRGERGPREGRDRPAPARVGPVAAVETVAAPVEPEPEKKQTTEKLFPLESSPPKSVALREDPGPAPHAAAVPEPESDEEEAPAGENDDSLAEIYVNVGRRDGAKPSDIEAALQGAGLSTSDADYIRVRHRHAFVGVKPELLEKALGALNGATIAGKRASAERARRI